MNLAKGGPAVFWAVPERQSPLQIVLGTKRGNLEDIRLEQGITSSGEVLDAEGKPVPNVWVNVTDRAAAAEIQIPVATSLQRSGKTDREGKFELAALKPGKYEIQVEGYPAEVRFHEERKQNPERLQVPAVFPRRTIEIAEAAGPIVVQAVPHVLFDGQIYDSKGEKKGGHEIHFFGKFDGTFHFGELEPDAKGHITGMLPLGLEETRLSLMTNEHGALRHRLGKDKPLKHGRDVTIGTVESDIVGFEIVRYTAPVVLIKVVDEEGNLLRDANVAGIYESADEKDLLSPVGGIRTSIFFEKQPDGRHRTSQLLPDESTKFVAVLDGFEKAEKVSSFEEGTEHEVVLVLKKASTSEADTATK
jgi:protocatechuate 3,4-dioxygenase beta subunit